MDSNEKIARDSSLNMNQRLEAIEALCADEAGGEVASQVVLDCLRSDSFESKFLGLICAYRFSNSVEIKGIIQKLASWPSQEPFEIRKQAVCALATTDCEMTASKLQGYLNHCEECCAVSWNRCIIRLANRLTSAEAERFLRSVIYDADFSAYIEDAQVGMVRLGDPLAIDWAVRQIESRRIADMLCVECCFALAWQGNRLGIQRLRNWLGNLLKLEDKLQSHIWMMLITDFGIVSREPADATAEAMQILARLEATEE